MNVPRPSSRGLTATLSLLVAACSILGPTARTALACPRCYTGALVRSAVLGPTFFLDLLLVSLPFMVMGSIALVVHRVGTKR